MTSALQGLVSGAMIGGLYAIMALGLSVSWGLLKIINLAHFGLILLAAYVTFSLTTATGMDPLLTALVSVPAFFVVGVGLHWALDHFRVSEFNSLLVTFGLLLVVVQAITNVWSADFQRIPSAQNPYATSSISIGDLALPIPRVLAFAVAVGIALVARHLLRSTYVGKALRAVGQDREMAAAFGIDPTRIATVVAGLSAATAALAGTLVGISSGIFPELAFEWFGIVFTVVILGGIGSVLGVVVAGVLVGALSGVVATVWQPAVAPLVVFVVLVLALLFRPHGLLGGGRAKA